MARWMLTAAIASLVAAACAKTVVEDAAPAAIPAEPAAEAPAPPEIITEAMYPAPEKQPNYGPAYGSITFTDTDPSEAIGGTMTMGRALDAAGEGVDEAVEGISMYMVHWGLEVGEPGVEDDKGAGDHGGDCRAFRDTGYVVMAMAENLGSRDSLTWEIPAGTEVPDDAVYFVGHSIYGEIHNLGKCTQIPIVNWVE